MWVGFPRSGAWLRKSELSEWLVARSIRLCNPSQRFQFGDDAIEFLDERIATGAAKRSDQFAVIPKRPDLLTGKSFEHRITVHAKFEQRFPSVGEFIGRRDEPNLLVFAGYACNIVALSIEPGSLWLRVGVGAAIDDVLNPFAEFLPYFAQARKSTLILHRIVKKGGDGHIFIASVLDDDGSNSQQVSDIGPFRTFANLPGMNAGRIAQRRDKPLGEDMRLASNR